MMDAFTQMAHDWANFFGALAQVSGALVGLVFVALTFNAKKLGVGGDPLLGALARQTFADFMLLLFVSMLMLTPHMSGQSAGTVLFAFTALGILRLLRNLSRLGAHFRRWKILQRFVPSAIGQLLLGYAAIQLMRGDLNSDLGSLLFAGTLPVMLSGCRSAWMLVMHEQELAP